MRQVVRQLELRVQKENVPQKSVAQFGAKFLLVDEYRGKSDPKYVRHDVPDVHQVESHDIIYLFDLRINLLLSFRTKLLEIVGASVEIVQTITVVASYSAVLIETSDDEQYRVTSQR